MTNFFLKKPNNIKVFFISIIGPKTRNARMEPSVKVEPNDEAKKASAEEHTERTYPSPIIAIGAKVVLVPIDKRTFRSKKA